VPQKRWEHPFAPSREFGALTCFVIAWVDLLITPLYGCSLKDSPREDR
jgi:hypothetical protein